MSENASKTSLRDRIRWQVYEWCFAYCVRCIHPDADPDEFSIIDNTHFVAVSKDEIGEIVEEAPDIAWRFNTEPEI